MAYNPMAYNVYVNNIAYQGKYRIDDKVVAEAYKTPQIITGIVLSIKFKNNEFWYNLSGYGWLQEQNIICTVKH
jgi:hypothetical protein